MAGVNKAIILGRLGKDPEARTMPNGGKTVSFSVATSESWKDRESGERKERVFWHRVVIFNEKLGEIAERYLKKGSNVYLEGSIETRKYTDKTGAERETAEIVLSKFKGELTLLDGKPSNDDAPRERAPAQQRAASPSWDAPKGGGGLDMSDDIPFAACWQ